MRRYGYAQKEGEEREEEEKGRRRKKEGGGLGDAATFRPGIVDVHSVPDVRFVRRSFDLFADDTAVSRVPLALYREKEKGGKETHLANLGSRSCAVANATSISGRRAAPSCL